MRLLIVLFLLCAVLGHSNGSPVYSPQYASNHTSASWNNHPTNYSNINTGLLNHRPTYYGNVNTASLNNRPSYASNTTAYLNNRPTYVSNTTASLNNRPTYYSNYTGSLNNRPPYAFNTTTASRNNYTTTWNNRPTNPSWNNRTASPSWNNRTASPSWNNRTASPSWNNRTTSSTRNNRTTSSTRNNRITSPPRIKKTEIHYHYSPPQALTYWGKSYPVYQGQPPVYVYEYRNSGSRFDHLLTGLALYNLGRNSQYHHHSYPKRYDPISGEICKLGIGKQGGEYVETRIDCDLMSSFIWEDMRNEQHFGVANNFVEDALKMKGPSIDVTPGMTCYMIRTLHGVTVMQRPEDCALLQEYSRSSLHRNVAQVLMPLKTIVFNFLIILFLRN